MSVVCWDGKTLAADKQITSSEMLKSGRKIYQTRAGNIAAFTGSLEQGLVLIRWHEAGSDESKWPAFQRTADWTRLIIANSMHCVTYDQEPIEQVIDGPFAAWGTGRDFAMGAMAMGANAAQAVEIASRYNVYCGCGVDVFELK